MRDRWIDQFDDVVALYPDAPAVHADVVVTYATLQDKARRFASFLMAQKIEAAEPRILLNIPKSADYIAAILGCLYAGCAFTPLDPSLPQERRDFIQNDIEPHLIVGQSDVPQIMMHEPLSAPCDYALDHLAYIIYTSGSTGTPKGVMLTHTGLSNVIEQQIQQFDIGVNDHSLLLLSISFDASLSDIFCALLSGACLHIEGGDKQAIAADLPDIMARRNITHIDIPPSMLRVLSPAQMPDTLRSIIIGGEVCPFDTVKSWAPHYRLNNVYGPTEASICTSMIRCEADEWQRPLIGAAMANVEYVIQDQELWIGGIQLARGYWQRDDLTQQKFIIHDNGRRYYKTGDHVQCHDDGHISFLGRLDRQVKIRGQLVELEEVEAGILKRAEIKRCAVIAREDSKGKKHLLAYYTAEKALDEEVLKGDLARVLAEWMVPSFFIHMLDMPLTSSGKVDVKALEIKEFSSGFSEVLAPQTDLEKNVWSMWSAILERDDFGVEDSFFALGGDSVDAIDFTMRAAREGLHISPSMLSQNFTIASLTKMLRALSTDDRGIDVDILREKAMLPDDLITCSHVPKSKGKAVFLTGATGFLGARLLFDILNETQRSIICLVRAVDEDTGWRRVQKALSVRGRVLTAAQKQRVTVICGDLAQDNLGLSPSVWGDVCAETHSIVHCAAIVNMVKSFDDLRCANLDACFQIMRLARDAGAHHVHYISTLSVFVSTDQNTGTVCEGDMLQNIGAVYGGYAQTKVAAELAFHHSDFTQQCPVTSYRLGLITGDTHTGHSAAHDFLSMFVKGLIALGAMPECDAERLMIDVTPVDYASEVLGRLITQEGAHQECYHIANEAGFSFAQIAAAIQKRGYNIRVISQEKWASLPQEKELSSAEQAAWLGLCRALGAAGYAQYRSMDLFQATDIVFDTTNTKASCSGLECPVADDRLLDLYLDQMLPSAQNVA